MAGKYESGLITPNFQRSKKFKNDKLNVTPMLIPPSPCMKRLGYGTGVHIYLMERFSPMRGCYKSPWAVKKLSTSVRGNNVDEIKKRLDEETELLMKIDHPNIIGFRSQGKSIDGKTCLVMESGEKSLSDIIEQRSEENLGPLPSQQILKVAESVASALDYLHRKCRILHGDLKSPNILIKGDFDAVKLCDFGVTVKLNDESVCEGCEYIGTECWSAPEVINGEQLSNKTDMFSYGLVLWEMISLSAPHLDHLSLDDDILNGSNVEAAEEAEARNEEVYAKALGTRPPLPEVDLDSSYNKILEIFFVCTETKPDSRLSAQEILESFFAKEEESGEK